MINIIKTGVCYFEEAILNELESSDKRTVRSRVVSACDSLKRFLNKHKQLILAEDFLKAKKEIEDISGAETLSDTKVTALFSQLNDLKDHLIEEKTNPQKLDIESCAKKLQSLEVQMRAVATIRENLAKMKSFTKEIIDQQLFKSETAPKYSQILSKCFNAILQNILTHSVTKLAIQSIIGPDITQWSAVALGSIAREEGHPYSDIDFLILVDSQIENEEQTKKYFKALMQEFADTVHQVGETSNGFKLCGGNLTPPYLTYDHRYASDALQAGGMGSFLTSPEKLAVMVYQSAISFMPLKGNVSLFKKPLTGNENLIGPALLDAKPIFGNGNLFDQFIELKNQLGKLQVTELFDDSQFENSPFRADLTAERLAYRSILGSLTQKRSHADYERKKLNIKKDFSRPIQMGASVLANQFGIKETNTVLRLDALAKINILSEAKAEEIKAVYLQLYQMRIEESNWFKRETDEVILAEEVFIELEKRMDLMSEALIKLKQQEPKGTEETLLLRQQQDVYANEHLNLFKLVSMRRLTDPSILEHAKRISCHVLDCLRSWMEDIYFS